MSRTRLLGDVALEAAAERRLDRDLDLPPRLDGPLRRRDDPLRRLGRPHAGVLPAVGLGGRDAEADHLDAAGERAVEPLLVQDEAGVDGVPVPLRPRRREPPEELVGVGHLRHLLRVDEGADLDDVEAGRAERVDPAELRLRRDDRLLDLEPVAGPDLVEDDAARPRRHVRAPGRPPRPCSSVVAVPPMS